VEVLLNSNDAKPLPGELVYETVSPVVATDFLPPDILDARKRIRVGASLEVNGRPGWYAIGDASSVEDPKNGSNAVAQGEYVAAHLLASLNPGQKTVKSYRTGKLVVVVPIGRTRGVAQLPFGVVTWKFLINLKRKDFFVGRYRRELGVADRS
jgi:NADH dehydrogenase FAD-containing subunit